MACTAELLMLHPLTTCVSAADKKLAHPNPIETAHIVCDTIQQDKRLLACTCTSSSTQ
jgi:hypothetical protein